MTKHERSILVDVFLDLLERQTETIAAIQSEDYPTALMGAVEDRERIRRLLSTTIGAPGAPAPEHFEGEQRTDDDADGGR